MIEGKRDVRVQQEHLLTRAHRIGITGIFSSPLAQKGGTEMGQALMNRIVLAHAGLRTRSQQEEGQALVEYALIVSLIAIAAVVILQVTGTKITGIFSSVNSDL